MISVMLSDQTLKYIYVIEQILCGYEQLGESIN
jgi:hypothetical protein